MLVIQNNFFKILVHSSCEKKKGIHTLNGLYTKLEQQRPMETINLLLAMEI